MFFAFTPMLTLCGIEVEGERRIMNRENGCYVEEDD